MLVPGVLALLPEYAGLADPVADLRAACLAAVRWLGEDGPVEIVASAQGERVAEALLDAAGVSRLGRQGALAPRPPVGSAGGGGVLVVGNGSARRTEKAPGHLDERAAAFDHDLDRALREGDAAALGSIDKELSRELWADTGHLSHLAGFGPAVSVDHDDAPFGVQYWVMRWEVPGMAGEAAELRA